MRPKRRKTNILNLILTILLCVCVLLLGAELGMFAYNRFMRNDEAETGAKEENEPKKQDESKVDDGTQNAAVLKKTADAGREYTEETLFLGDSNTVRFMMFNDTDGLPFTDESNTIAVVGMGAEGITTVPCEQFDFGTVSMDLAVSYLQPRRIILTFGTNNLDVYNVTAKDFIENYEAQIHALENSYPYADLIINSIPPVGKISSYPKITIGQVKEFNQAILKMCEKNEWKYLNSFEALYDTKTGYAKAEYIEYDGIHYNEKGLAALFRYIRTHAWIKEDERPKPLNEIPYLIGPVTEIFTVDPITEQPFDENIFNPQPEITDEPEIPYSEPAEEPVIEETPVPDTEIPAEEPVIEEPDPEQDAG